MAFVAWASIIFGFHFAAAQNGRVSVTPHDQFGSSIGVLGCKINHNRVAHWPRSPDCDHLCLRLTLGDRTVHVLHVDQSEGAHDISYDAYNFLVTGVSATEGPIQGGGEDVDYEYVGMSECGDILDQGDLPLSASNSMNFLTKCLSQGDNWLAKNHVLYNIVDPQCNFGVDEKCTLHWPEENQPRCQSLLGTPRRLGELAVSNIPYGTEDIV